MQATLDALGRAATLEPADDDVWCSTALQAVEAAKATWQRHVVATEAPQGILADVVEREPRLAHLVATLRTDHGEIQALIDQASARLHDGDATAGHPAVATLTERMARHHDRGAEMLHELYDVDLGGGG